MQPIPVGQPFKCIGIDLIGLLTITATRKWYIIVAIDYLTKWIEAKAVTAKEADKIIAFIHEVIITWHGVSKEIVTGFTFPCNTCWDSVG